MCMCCVSCCGLRCTVTGADLTTAKRNRRAATAHLGTCETVGVGSGTLPPSALTATLVARGRCVRHLGLAERIATAESPLGPGTRSLPVRIGIFSTALLPVPKHVQPAVVNMTRRARAPRALSSLRTLAETPHLRRVGHHGATDRHRGGSLHSSRCGASATDSSDRFACHTRDAKS